MSGFPNRTFLQRRFWPTGEVKTARGKRHLSDVHWTATEASVWLTNTSKNKHNDKQFYFDLISSSSNPLLTINNITLKYTSN